MAGITPLPQIFRFCYRLRAWALKLHHQVEIPTPQFTSCVTLDKLLNFPFLSLSFKWRYWYQPSHWVVIIRMQWYSMGKALSSAWHNKHLIRVSCCYNFSFYCFYFFSSFLSYSPLFSSLFSPFLHSSINCFLIVEDTGTTKTCKTQLLSLARGPIARK